MALIYDNIGIFNYSINNFYTGATCGIVLPRSSAPDNTSINSATASMTIASSSQDSQSEKEGIKINEVLFIINDLITVCFS